MSNFVDVSLRKARAKFRPVCEVLEQRLVLDVHAASALASMHEKKLTESQAATKVVQLLGQTLSQAISGVYFKSLVAAHQMQSLSTADRQALVSKTISTVIEPFFKTLEPSLYKQINTLIKPYASQPEMKALAAINKALHQDLPPLKLCLESSLQQLINAQPFKLSFNAKTSLHDTFKVTQKVTPEENLLLILQMQKEITIQVAHLAVFSSPLSGLNAFSGSLAFSFLSQLAGSSNNAKLLTDLGNAFKLFKGLDTTTLVNLLKNFNSASNTLKTLKAGVTAFVNLNPIIIN